MDVSLTVLRLPPRFEAVVGEGGDHVLDGVAGGVGVLVVHLPGVAHEAFLLFLRDRERTVLQASLSSTKPKDLSIFSLENRRKRENPQVNLDKFSFGSNYKESMEQHPKTFSSILAAC